MVKGLIVAFCQSCPSGWLSSEKGSPLAHGLCWVGQSTSCLACLAEQPRCTSRFNRNCSTVFWGNPETGENHLSTSIFFSTTGLTNIIMEGQPCYGPSYWTTDLNQHSNTRDEKHCHHNCHCLWTSPFFKKVVLKEGQHEVLLSLMNSWKKRTWTRLVEDQHGPKRSCWLASHKTSSSSIMRCQPSLSAWPAECWPVYVLYEMPSGPLDSRNRQVYCITSRLDSK